MGLLGDAGKTFIKYSEKIVEKTEEYTRIAKLTLDIKKCDESITQAQADMGRYVMQKIDEGATELSLSDDYIKTTAGRINELKESISRKRQEIRDIREAAAAKKVNQ